MKKPTILIFLFVILLTACASPPAQTPEIIEVTKIVEQTVVVTELVVVTATPEPPTPTPEPTATPQFIKWNSQDAVNALLAAGLEAESTYTMTKDDYGPAPLVAIEGTRFIIPSLCADCGGRIFSFDSQENLEKMKQHYISLGETSAWFFSWIFEYDNILIQINGDLPEEKAMQYKEALENIE